MRLGVTGKVTLIVMVIVFSTVSVLVAINYKSSHHHVWQAAGIELIGCANITTGIIDPKALELVISGDQSALNQVENEIDWTIGKKDIFETHYILSLDGKVLAADTNLKRQGFQAGDNFYVDQEAMNMVKNMRHAEFTYIYEFGGMERLSGYAPIFKDHDPTKEIIAINVIDFDASIVKERTWEMAKTTILIGLLLPFIAAGITVLIIRAMVKPVVEISKHVKEVANGNLNVKPLTFDNKDEIGQLSKDFNAMTANLQKIIENVSLNSQQVAATSQQLSASTEETTRATNNISIAIQDVSQGAEEQMNIAKSANQDMDSVVKTMEDVTNVISKANEASKQAASTALTGNQNVGKVIEQMNVIGSNTNLISDTIHSLNEKSQRINQIISLITDVAEQTNLLALNAAIEAARAGEHGKGFAVVADEVRKLSDQTGKATEQISYLINEIQGEVTNSVKTIDIGSNAVKEGISIVNHTSESFKGILQATSTTSEQLNVATSNVTEIQSQIQKMVEIINDIAAISTRTSENTENIASSAQEQNAMMKEIAHATSELAHMAEALQETIEIFK